MGRTHTSVVDLNLCNRAPLRCRSIAAVEAPARLTGRDELQLQKGAPDAGVVCIAIRSTLGNLARGWDRWDAVTVARTVRVAKNQIDLEVFVQLIALRWVWGIRVVRIWKVGSLLRRENLESSRHYDAQGPHP